MKKLTIRNTEIDALGFGTYKLKGQECRYATSDALAMGYRHIDTAQIYENEEEVGLGIKDSKVKREEIFLVTKVWFSNASHKDTIKSTEISLRKLKTDYVDLIHIHWLSEIPFDETLDAMLKLREQGKVKHIGVCNFPTSQLKMAIKQVPDLFAIQVEYHCMLSQEKVLEVAKQYGLTLTAYSPLAQGALLGNQALANIAKRHNKSEAQIALRWLIEQDNVSAIPKAASPKNRKQNLEIFDFQLTQEDLEEIKRLDKNRRVVRPTFEPVWDSID
jgi:diketogulonate reductase-like aldo/keto reductase